MDCQKAPEREPTGGAWNLLARMLQKRATGDVNDLPFAKLIIEHRAARNKRKRIAPYEAHSNTMTLYA